MCKKNIGTRGWHTKKGLRGHWKYYSTQQIFMEIKPLTFKTPRHQTKCWIREKCVPEKRSDLLPWSIFFCFNLEQKSKFCLVSSLQTFQTGVAACVCTHSFSKHSHELGKLVCEQSQHGGEGAETGCEEDEEGQLLLRVDWHLVKHCFHVGHTHTHTHTHTQTHTNIMLL